MNSYVSMLGYIYDVVECFVSSALYYNLFVPLVCFAILFCAVKVVWSICTI